MYYIKHKYYIDYWLLIIKMKNSKVTVIALLMGLNNAEVLNLQQQTDSGLITE